jgi:hypothetical protein
MKLKFYTSWNTLILLNVVWFFILFLIVKYTELNELSGSFVFLAIALTVIIDVKAFIAWQESKNRE